jgi:4-methyl-5(b-hydroxyethyl)-thiazole monophosphate biosynthesis
MNDAEKILVPLAEGFEEIELTTLVDVLRRADLDVTIASLVPGRVRGSHGIVIEPDACLADLDTSVFTMIVLPGGQPGTRNLAADERILDIVRRLSREKRRIAAICAAPLVLQKAGILRGVEVTAHPSVQAQLVDAVVATVPRVVKSGSVLTSQGAGTALEFALALVAELKGRARADELAAAMRV